MSTQNFPIQVYVRHRPLTACEIKAKKSCIIKNMNQIEVSLEAVAYAKTFTFDRVFGAAASQEEVYDVVVSRLVDSMLLGNTCSVFAYGASKTGKSYTLLGPNIGPTVDFVNDPSIGMIPRVAVDIFNKLSQLGVEYDITASFVELHSEEIRDLVVADGSCLSIIDDPHHKGSTRLNGVFEVPIKKCTELFEMLLVGASNRNGKSLHCHTIFSIVATMRETAKGENIVKIGKIHLIDLAGSDYLRSCVSSPANRGLQTFKKVIQVLASKSTRLPIQDSKLTRILQDCLNGKGNTSIIATFSPCTASFEDTVTTFDFVQMARGLSTNPVPNVTNVRRDDKIKNVEDEVSSLRRDLTAAGSFRRDVGNYQKLIELKVNHENAIALTAEVAKLAAVSGNLTHYPEESEELPKRYEPQAEANNAQVAKDMVEASFQSLSKVESAVELFQRGERQYLSEVTANNSMIRENLLEDVSRLQTLLSDVFAFADSLQCSLDSLLRGSEFTESSARSNLRSTHIENHLNLANNYHRVRTSLTKLGGLIYRARKLCADATFQYEDDVGMQFSLLSDMFEKLYSLLTSLHSTMQCRYLRIQRLMSHSNERVLLWNKFVLSSLSSQEDLTEELETIFYVRGYINQTTDLLKEKASAADNN